MEMDEGLHEERGETPPPMDESWWSAVLQDEGRHATYEHERSNDHIGDKSENFGDPEDWVWARELYDKDDTIELPVIGYNRGGLLVEARSLRGFIPISHLVEIQQEGEEVDFSDHLSEMIGSDLILKVIEFDPDRGRLVFSERAALAGPGKRAELLATLQPGECIEGAVTNITRFGVFVDLGGVEGLIHVSELSWGRVRHPSDVVECGQNLKVQILSVDRNQGRVALSLKELLPDPWASVEGRYQVGEFVEGVVTNVVKFGAFVGIEEGLEGLIHVSELGDGNLLHPRNVVREGEKVRVRIIHIDAADRRLGLSLRQVPQRNLDESEPEESSESPEAFSSIV
ncbi:MAG: S1 RNA-binding domain-containing protein [Anaerolineales bacterium]|nr:S1 RNA-binding domain-containing protein [Anaerolineales bacterium]